MLLSDGTNFRTLHPLFFMVMIGMNRTNSPISPQHMDWSHMFPDIKDPVPSFVDIGCGFGSLLLQLGRQLRSLVVFSIHSKQSTINLFDSFFIE